MRSHLRSGLLPALLAGTAAVSCAEAPPPPPAVARIDTPAPTPPPPPPARWVDSGGATLIGPRVARGTVVLVGGRRMLVLPDGAIEAEKAATPEALAEITLVPSAGGVRLVGRGPHDVYRFDDPLGAPTLIARSEQPLSRLGAGPGMVALWSPRSDLPRFVDVETGKEGALAGLPEPPLRAIAFLDAKRGAAVFEAVGLAITTDGGATWRAASGGSPKDALTVNGLRLRGDAVRAFGFAEGPDGAIDLDRGHLGAMEAPPSAPSDPALLRWVRGSSRDPLEAAASSGLDLPTGGALVASHGMIARVDPRTGAVGDLVEMAHGKWVPCSAGRASGAAWIACTLPDAAAGKPHADRDSAGGDLFDPFGVMRVPLGEGKLTPERPELMRNGEADLRVSPSGGVMLTAACSSDEPGAACVRQPDGKWKTVAPDLELAERGPGPLADGRVAFLRGMFDGDEAAEPGPPNEDEEHARTKRLHVAVLGPGGKERALARIPFTPSRGYVRVQSPIEEDTDHSLHFVIEDGEGPYSVIVPAGKEAPSALRIPDASEARLRAGRGIAVGDGHILASLDAGATWHDVPAPPAAIEAARSVATGGDPPDALVVSEIGARIGSMLRLGWGPPDAAATPSEAPAPAPLAPLAAPAAPAAAPELVLTCTASGPSPGLAPLLGLSEARQLLTGHDGGRPPMPPGVAPAKPGPKHDSSVWGARINALEAVAMLEDDAADKRASDTWTLRWHDPRELGGKVRSAKVKVPNAGANPNLRYAAADGARALFAVRSAGKFRLIRVKPGGGSEVVEVPQDLVPSGETVFGSEKGEPIAWIKETRVIVWRAGEKPRPIAELATHAPRALGTPTAAGVPLLVGANDWALLRVLPIPPLDKGAPDKPPPPAPVALDGWTRVPPVRRALGSLPVCAGKVKGARFAIERSALRAEIEGASQSATTAVYHVRIAGNEACVDGLAATLTAGRRGGSPKPPPPSPGSHASKHPAKQPSTGAAFVRVDLMGKNAEGGTRGLAPSADVRRMKCTLAPKG